MSIENKNNIQDDELDEVVGGVGGFSGPSPYETLPYDYNEGNRVKAIIDGTVLAGKITRRAFYCADNGEKMPCYYFRPDNQPNGIKIMPDAIVGYA